jgi:hypothetical protein
VKPAGLSLPTAKYRDVDPTIRAARRAAWNKPVRWPAFGLGGLALAAIVPAVAAAIRRSR